MMCGGCHCRLTERNRGFQDTLCKRCSRARRVANDEHERRMQAAVKHGSRFQPGSPCPQCGVHVFDGFDEYSGRLVCMGRYSGGCLSVWNHDRTLDEKLTAQLRRRAKVADRKMQTWLRSVGLLADVQGD